MNGIIGHIVGIVTLIMLGVMGTPQLGTMSPTAPSVPGTVATVKPDLALIARDYPRVDGSTSTLPLHVIVACKAWKVPWVWQKLLSAESKISPDPKSVPASQIEAIWQVVQHTGTNTAYMNLIQGKKDLILVAREPSPDELQAAKNNRVELDTRAFALDAFVILVNVNNPVDDLSIDQVREVYTGKSNDWATLGGKGQIKAYQRDRNSGSQELMESLVMKGAPMIKAPEMINETMMGAVNAIGREPLGIGYSVYYYVTYMLPDKNVKLVGINGVKPTSENIATRAYPLTAPVYAVTRKNMPPTSSAVMLRDWLLTDQGRTAIAESGYVPLTTR